MYIPDGGFEVAEGMARLHLDPSYRAMLLEEGIKPVFRISNLDAARTRAELERFRGLGYFAAPCHEGFDFDEKGLYAFEGAGALFYLFVTTSQERLDEMLAVDRRQKTADTAETKLDSALEIGRLLGYPACCSRFYASFPVNPHQTTFLWRPWQATTGPIGAHQHPTLRPLGHFGCSLHCETTESVNARILEAMDRRMPEVGAWVRPAMRYPVLLFDHGATVFAGTGTDGRVDYARAWHVGKPRGPAEQALRDDLDAGDRVEVVGARIRVFSAGALLGDHDTRPYSLLPLLMPVDDEPVGKRVGHVAVPALDERARYLAGDLLHMGHRASWTRAPKGPAALWAASLVAAGVDTALFTTDPGPYAAAAEEAGVTPLVVGEHLPTDRHAFAHGFERWSRELPFEPAFDAPLPGRDLARAALMWPAQLLEDPLEGKRQQAVTHLLQDDEGPDRLASLRAQTRQHQGREIAVSPASVDLIDALLTSPTPLRLLAPVQPQRFRELAKRASTGIRQAVPQAWVEEALAVLRENQEPIFTAIKLVDDLERTRIRCSSIRAPELQITVWMTEAGWQFTLNRQLGPREKQWVVALKALLRRAEATG